MWNVISSVVGLVGSVLVTYGVFSLNSDAIARQSLEYQEFNPEILLSSARQRAAILLGIVFIIIAFFVQIVVQFVALLQNQGSCLSLIVLCFIVLCIMCLGYFGNKLAGMVSVKKAKKAAAKWVFLYIVDMFRDEKDRKYKGDILSYRSTEELAQLLCNFNRRENESKEDFTERFIKHLNIESDINDVRNSQKWKNIVQWAWEERHNS
jgi:magnesium-transporting ATPase (P-type)